MREEVGKREAIYVEGGERERVGEGGREWGRGRGWEICRSILIVHFKRTNMYKLVCTSDQKAMFRASS